MVKLDKKDLKNELNKHLYDLLYKIANESNYFDPDTFVYCIIKKMDDDEKCKIMIDAIENYGITDMSKISLLGVYISRGLKP